MSHMALKTQMLAWVTPQACLFSAMSVRPEKKKKKQGSYCTKEESHVKRAHVTVLLVNPGFALAQRSLTARTKKIGS